MNCESCEHRENPVGVCCDRRGKIICKILLTGLKKQKLKSIKQEKDWSKKEIPSSGQKTSLEDEQKIGITLDKRGVIKGYDPTHSYDESGNWEEVEEDTIETRNFDRFSETAPYKQPKTRKGIDLIDKYNKRWERIKDKSGDRAKAMQSILRKLNLILCNDKSYRYFHEGAYSRYKHYSKYGKYCHKKNSIEDFLKIADMKRDCFLKPFITPFTPTEESNIETNLKEIVNTLPDKRREAVERLFFYGEKGTILAKESGTSRQNIHKLANKGLNDLRKNKDKIRVVDKNPYNEGSLATSSQA